MSRPVARLLKRGVLNWGAKLGYQGYDEGEDAQYPIVTIAAISCHVVVLLSISYVTMSQHVADNHKECSSEGVMAPYSMFERGVPVHPPCLRAW